jgi:hypothetical protein
MTKWSGSISGVDRYYFQGQKRYGSGFNGSYVCRKEAKSSGFNRSLLGSAL